MGKWAVVTVELVEASVECSNSVIAEELFRWLRGVVLLGPWVKEVKGVVVRDF